MDTKSEDATPLFRPSKKRKTYRRTGQEDETYSDVSGTIPGDGDGNSSRASQTALPAGKLSSGEVIHQRGALQRRKAGIEFASMAAAERLPSRHDPAQFYSAGSHEKVVTLSRFSRPAGVVQVDDNHMMAYIDHEMARKNASEITAMESSTARPGNPSGTAHSATTTTQAIASNKILEVDLGPDARARNIAATEAAQRQLKGLEPAESVAKPRTRRGGQPWRRNRRNSEDIKRDQLVEAILHETKLDIYAAPKPATIHRGDQAADEQFAEQFQREYLDSLEQRKQKTSASNQATKSAAGQEQSKGPKLGGSRSARAAMKEQQERGSKK